MRRQTLLGISNEQAHKQIKTKNAASKTPYLWIIPAKTTFRKQFVQNISTGFYLAVINLFLYLGKLIIHCI